MQIGNAPVAKAGEMIIAKMSAGGRSMATFLLGIGEVLYLFPLLVALVVYPTVQACARSNEHGAHSFIRQQ